MCGVASFLIPAIQGPETFEQLTIIQKYKGRKEGGRNASLHCLHAHGLTSLYWTALKAKTTKEAEAYEMVRLQKATSP